MDKTTEMRVIDTLAPHPRNTVLYGTEHEQYDEKLVASLKAGIWPGEIQVTTSNVIISGHRRCNHAIFAEIEQAEVWVRHDLPEDPNSPEVLEALLQGNLQRNKTKEQQLREFELWLEVEKEQRKGRNQHTKSADAQNVQEQPAESRQAAAERVGLANGFRAQEALKALKAADAAEATGDAEQVEKAKLVKRELTKSLGGAVRVAREQGLIPAPKKRAEPSQVQEVLDLTPPAVKPPKPSAPPLLSDLTKQWIKREKRAASQRAALLANLSLIEADLDKLFRAAQQSWDKDGRSVLRHHFAVADEQLTATGALVGLCEALDLPPNSTYREMLKGIDTKTKKISRTARQLIYLLGYTERPEE